MDFVGGPKDGDRIESLAEWGVGTILRFKLHEDDDVAHHYTVQEKPGGARYLMYAGAAKVHGE
jgi:hypothetical protein